MPREQERARARRRQAKVDARLAERRAARQRNRQTAAVVVAVLVVVALFVVLAAKLGGSSAPSGAAGATTTPGSLNDTVTAAGCTPPPAAPTTVMPMKLPDKRTAAGRTFVATLTTNCGDITIELHGDKAPQTVASFVSLARSGYWKDSPCHRLASFGVLQCGDPLGGKGTGPGYSFGIENAPKDGTYPKGTVAMARQQGKPDSNGDQFFICFTDVTLPTGDGGYSVFGTVTGGMDIVVRIAAAGVQGGAGDGPPAAPISILRAAVTEKKA